MTKFVFLPFLISFILVKANPLPQQQQNNAPLKDLNVNPNVKPFTSPSPPSSNNALLFDEAINKPTFVSGSPNPIPPKSLAPNVFPPPVSFPLKELPPPATKGLREIVLEPINVGDGNGNGKEEILITESRPMINQKYQHVPYHHHHPILVEIEGPMKHKNIEHHHHYNNNYDGDYDDHEKSDDDYDYADDDEWNEDGYDPKRDRFNPSKYLNVKHSHP